ncbi:MAG: PEP-utilizing enzyme, partial [Candidatus Shapirobacteria bacterium]
MKKFILHGIGGALGQTTGRVKVFKDISKINLLNCATIIVAPFTTPNITPFLPRIKAIITEKGGITSHAAILGREFGIPVILGVENATKKLKDDQWVMVNGIEGKIEILSKHSIQFAQWDITGKCNLRCRHCRAWKLPIEKELSTEGGKNLLSQLYDLKIQVLNFSGGEPFLRKDIFKLLDYAKDFPLLTITTNGTLFLDKEYIKMLKPFKNVRVSLSLDGLEKFHDNFRRVSGTFKKAITAVKNLTEESIRTSIRFTLTNLNENEAEPLFDFISKYKIESFNIRAVLPLGRADVSMMPSAKRYREILENLFVKSRKKKIPIISGDPILLPLFPELLGKVWDEMGEKMFSEVCAGCLAGEETLYIKPNGDVGVCA